MKRQLLFASLLALIAFIPLNAQYDTTLGCLYEPPQGGFQSLPASALEGPHKALVIAATAPDDIQHGWSNLTMPLWLRDSFIAPSPSQINTSQYKWSISNFWAAASHDEY